LDQNHQPRKTTAKSSPAWISKPRLDPAEGIKPREGGVVVEELMQRIPSAT
jgi:hypothetical protein